MVAFIIVLNSQQIMHPIIACTQNGLLPLSCTPGSRTGGSKWYRHESKPVGLRKSKGMSRRWSQRVCGRAGHAGS